MGLATRAGQWAAPGGNGLPYVCKATVMGYSMRTPEWRYSEWADFPDCLLKSGVLMREDSTFTARSDVLPDGQLCELDADCASGFCFQNLLGQKTCAPRPAGDCNNQWGPAMPCEESSDPRWDKICTS